jgi:hypothetical protein
MVKKIIGLSAAALSGGCSVYGLVTGIGCPFDERASALIALVIATEACYFASAGAAKKNSAAWCLILLMFSFNIVGNFATVKGIYDEAASGSREAVRAVAEAEAKAARYRAEADSERLTGRGSRWKILNEDADRWESEVKARREVALKASLGVGPLGALLGEVGMLWLLAALAVALEIGALACMGGESKQTATPRRRLGRGLDVLMGTPAGVRAYREEPIKWGPYGRDGHKWLVN